MCRAGTVRADSILSSPGLHSFCTWQTRAVPALGVMPVFHFDGTGRGIAHGATRQQRLRFGHLGVRSDRRPAHRASSSPKPIEMGPLSLTTVTMAVLTPGR